MTAALRILLTTWGWRSHFYGLAPLGWALQAAGHEVRVASHPSLVPAITAAGLAAVPLGRDLDFAEAFAGRIGAVGALDPAGPAAPDPALPAAPAPAVPATPDPATPEQDDPLEPAITADGGVVRFADALLDDLVGFGRAWRPDLMVWEPFNLAAPVAAAALGVPGVLHLWGPDSSVTLRLDPESVLGPLAGRFGLAASDVSLTGALTLDPVPPPMQVPTARPGRPVRFVPYNGPAVLPSWLHGPADRPRVCVTAGTMMAGVGLDDRLGLARVIRAVAGLDVEVVVLVEPAQQARLGPLPDNVRLVDAPLALRLVLPTCAALVQQGGAGSTMTALGLGVPQLVLPQVSDQHFNAERLAVTGAGTWLSPARADDDTLRALVGELIGDGHWRESAALMRDRVHAMPTPAEVVPALVALAASTRS
ncbi:UDP:flavonoid glycosyltransferase YjiC, YdhE family [Micromonospora rifamycinica]|uniref:UDP:flavonoid glycosyltransferase YjiC, YdhE family n=1 Tax=Micromonospora rifamycinica TaxID=291594 RepID=A0A1C5HZX8_9ACTN|nr:UDP:flavonoid glycosyltransferase YjiC, YdhE family [Micromonospora rifamycinica]